MQRSLLPQSREIHRWAQTHAGAPDDGFEFPFGYFIEINGAGESKDLAPRQSWNLTATGRLDAPIDFTIASQEVWLFGSPICPATTLNIRNEDFMAGNYIFNRGSLSAARREVINAGVLKAREISCGDISTAKDQDAARRTDQGDNKRLVEIKRGGVKMRDPCQQQPEQAQGRAK